MNGPTFGTNPVNLMTATQFELPSCNELNLKVLPTPCIEPSYTTRKTIKAVINACKKKVKNAMKDMIKEIVNLLDPAHCVNVDVQTSKAQKKAYGHLQNHSRQMAIALSKELCETANALSKCTSTEQKSNNHDTHKKPDVFGL